MGELVRCVSAFSGKGGLALRSRGDKVKAFLFFCGPTSVFFLTVILIPFLFGIYLTFTNWNGISNGYAFAGLDNYRVVLSDRVFWKSFWLTLRFVFFTVLFTNVLAFFLAYALTGGVRGQNTLRAGFFTPNLVGGILLGLIWNFLFSNVLPFIGQQLGLDAMRISMLGKPESAFWALVIVSVWQYSGYMMVIYIAGFTNMPADVLEAASIDGAGKRQRLTSIIVPLMVPSFIICTFLTLQRSFMVYDVNLALTDGGPFKTTQMISMHVYEKAFLSQNFGVGQAEAVFLFLIVALVTVTQLSVSKRWEAEA